MHEIAKTITEKEDITIACFYLPLLGHGSQVPEATRQVLVARRLDRLPVRHLLRLVTWRALLPRGLLDAFAIVALLPRAIRCASLVLRRLQYEIRPHGSTEQIIPSLFEHCAIWVVYSSNN
jgi:hypothetical protein